MRLDSEEVRRLLGSPTPQSQLPVEVKRGSVENHRGVDIERIELVAPDRVVPALLLSINPPPWPAAVVALHQHARRFDLGKSEPAGLAGDPQMAYGLRMAAKGIPVVAPDLLGFEERKPLEEDPASAEQRMAWELVASGRTLQGHHSDDVSLAVSWLVNDAGVAGPVGVIGHSLGGQVSLFTMAMDTRISAGVISCGAGTLESFAHEGILHNPAYYVPGLAAAGDVPAVVAGLRGRSLRLLAGDSDPLFPAAGVDAVAAAMDPAHAHAVRFRGGHDFPLTVQRPAIDWLAGRLTSSLSGTNAPAERSI